MAHCQYFPISAQDLGNGICARCSYVNLSIVSKGRKAKLVENSKMTNLIAPESQSVVFIDEPGVYTTEESVYLEGEFSLPTVHVVTGTYSRGATFSFSVISDADSYPLGLSVALKGCDSHIVIEQPVFNEEKKFVSGVSAPLLQAIVDTCGGYE